MLDTWEVRLQRWLHYAYNYSGSWHCHVTVVLSYQGHTCAFYQDLISVYAQLFCYSLSRLEAVLIASITCGCIGLTSID